MTKTKNIMTKRFVKDQSANLTLNNDKLMDPKPGVAYAPDTDLVYFNNVVLPQGGGAPETHEAFTRLENQNLVG